VESALGLPPGRRAAARALPRRRPARPLFKTPSAQNLEHFFELFPEASLLILVRDGRDVVESTTRSFAAGHEAATRAWCRAAREVCDFDRRRRGDGRHRIVRYEDLVREPEATLRGLFAFLGLDAARYDFAAARDLPVFGSSTFRGESAELHWEPVAKSDSFQPLGRASSWSPERRRRFAWLAGDPMRALGYELEARPAPADRWRQRLLDAAWQLRERTRRAAQRTKRA
jgi:protein-tyrosine sulfotransferase